MELSCFETDEWFVLTVDGEIERFSCTPLADCIEVALHESRRDVLVDLQGTTFIDAGGLGVLVPASHELRRQGRTMALLCRDGLVDLVLHAGGLSDLIRDPEVLHEAAPITAGLRVDPPMREVADR
ncbi:MAG: STAS domain-containing protein [Dermatophilaceae bacterium]